MLMFKKRTLLMKKPNMEIVRRYDASLPLVCPKDTQIWTTNMET